MSNKQLVNGFNISILLLNLPVNDDDDGGRFE